MPNICPACRHPATGRFCSNCGANLEERVPCTACGNQLPVGGRFCNKCGEPTAATREATPKAAPAAIPAGALWGIGGLAVGALVVALVVGAIGGGEDEAPTAPFAAGSTAPATGDPGAVDLSSMTAREAADRLFNRVVGAAEGGDSAQARQFLPMALQAYAMVPPAEVVPDVRYHRAVLHMVNGDPASALAEADSILSAAPTHLFGLFTRAQAQGAMGNADAARDYYERFLSAYDPEIAKALAEYGEHSRALEVMRQDASRAVDSL